MNYQIRNGGHNYDLLSISFANQTFMIRAFERYTGSIEGRIIINSDNFYSDLNNYPTDSAIFVYQGTTYVLRWYRQVGFNEDQLQAGGTYAVIKDIDTCRVLRLDTAKYPDLDISDWNWIRMRSYKPMIVFHVFNDSKTFESVNWKFCLIGDFESTAIAFSGTIEPTIYDYKDVTIVPQFECLRTENTVTISANNPTAAGPLNFRCINGSLPMQSIWYDHPIQLTIDDNTHFDVLFGYNVVVKDNGFA